MSKADSHIQKLTDEELIIQYRQTSDTYWVGELFQRYTEWIFLACMKYLKNEEESEDASMQIFEKLMKDLKVYDINIFSHWIRVVVRNHCLGILRQQKKKQAGLEELKQHPERVETVFYLRPEYEQKEWELVQLEKAIASLGEDQRRCVELFFLEKKSYKEVCEETNFSMKQVKSFLQNGKRNLKNVLNQLLYEG